MSSLRRVGLTWDIKGNLYHLMEDGSKAFWQFSPSLKRELDKLGRMLGWGVKDDTAS